MPSNPKFKKFVASTAEILTEEKMMAIENYEKLIRYRIVAQWSRWRREGQDETETAAPSLASSFTNMIACDAQQAWLLSYAFAQLALFFLHLSIYIFLAFAVSFKVFPSEVQLREKMHLRFKEAHCGSKGFIAPLTSNFPGYMDWPTCIRNYATDGGPEGLNETFTTGARWNVSTIWGEMTRYPEKIEV